MPYQRPTNAMNFPIGYKVPAEKGKNGSKQPSAIIPIGAVIVLAESYWLAVSSFS